MTIDAQRLRPLSLGDVFDAAFDLYKGNFRYLLLVAAVAAVPLNILVAVVTLRLTHDLVGLAGALNGRGGAGPDLPQVFAWLGPLAGGAAVVLPLYLVGYAVQMTALASAASACYLGRPRTVWGAYRPNLRRLFPLLVTALLYGLFAALGFLGFLLWFLLLMPLLLPCYIATRLLFTAHAFAVEGLACGKALGRSNALVAGYGMSVFGALLTLGVLSFVLILGIERPFIYAFDLILQITPGGEHLWGGGSALTGLSLRRQVVEQVAEGLAGLLVVPYLLSVVTVLYYDLRVRKEAFDIELLARGLGYPPLPREPAAYPAAAVPPPLAPRPPAAPGGAIR